MGNSFGPIVPPSLPCKCCSGDASIFGVVDFNKRAENLAHARNPCGIPIYYHRCHECGFVFTTAFDHFTPEELSHWIYNAEYLALDNDYVHARPHEYTAKFTRMFEANRDIRILDYGCGNGEMVRMLREAGFASVDGYDPFVPEFARVPSKARYDVVSCIEVVEHSLHPRQTFTEIEHFLKHDGIVIFTTLLQPPDIEELRTGWWYIAPRNGHVSIFTVNSIMKLARPQGLQLSCFTTGMHVLHRDPPRFARHLFPPANPPAL
jgi:SAM-dependent methyltransferase